MKLLPLLMLAVSISAFAGGNEGGNGGNTVVCKNAAGAITSVELLDFYEARVLRGFTVDLGAADGDIQGKLDLVFTRLAKFRPLKAKRLAANAALFQQNANILANVDLPTTNDSFNLILPEGCSIVQTVIQKKPEFPEDKTFIVKKDIWDALDTNNKAGLILHEIFYQEALKNSAVVDSVAIRYFNAFLASTKFSELNEAGFEKIEAFVPWPTQEFFAAEFNSNPGGCVSPVSDLEPIEVDGVAFTLAANGCDQLGFSAVQSLTTSSPIGVAQDANGIHLAQKSGTGTNSTVTYYPGGAVQSVTHAIGSKVLIDGESLSAADDSEIDFSATGQVTHATITPTSKFSVNTKNGPVSVTSASWDANWNLTAGTLDRPTTLTINGSKVRLATGMALQFSPSGLLTEASGGTIDVAVAGGNIHASKIDCDDQGNITSVDLASETTLMVGTQKLTFGAYNRLTFLPGGLLYRAGIDRGTTHVNVGPDSLTITSAILAFDSNGNLTSIQNDYRDSLTVHAGSDTIEVIDTLDFDSQGRLTFASELADDAWLTDVKGHSKYLKRNSSYLIFNSDGQLVSANAYENPCGIDLLLFCL